jgi:hypothetical protein
MQVRVYRFQAEPSEVNCHVISSLDNPKGTEVLLKATAQFQCVVALGVHRSSIQCVAIASSFQLSAAGDANGLVSFWPVHIATNSPFMWKPLV